MSGPIATDLKCATANELIVVSRCGCTARRTGRHEAGGGRARQAAGTLSRNPSTVCKRPWPSVVANVEADDRRLGSLRSEFPAEPGLLMVGIDGYDAARGGFRCGRLRMLHGGSYIAYFSDALLRAAWVEGDLGHVAREPKWWHRDDPGVGMSNSVVEIRCVDEGFELVLPADDEATATRALDVVQQFGGAGGSRILIGQDEFDGVPTDSQDRVQVCIKLVRALHIAGL